MEITKENVGEVLVNLKKSIEPHLAEKNLVTQGILDSLDIMNLIMDLESTFDVEIPPEDVLSENFESVEAIMALIEKCRG